MIGGSKLELIHINSIHKRFSLLFVLLYLHLKSGHSTLITYPRDTEVLVNQSTYFNCSTSILSEQIHWYHNRVGENQTNYVYYKGQFNQIYADRYSIEINNKTGEYNLIIRSVKPDDAGQYVCQDDVGLGHSSPAELIALEYTPECLSSMKSDGFVGPNSCNLYLETLQLSCSVSYNGNFPPMLQWNINGNDAPISRGIATRYSGKRATVNLTMSSEVEMDGKSFTCGTTRSQDKQSSCTTDSAKINYAVGQPTILNTAKGETITCSANASVPCTYRWFYDNDAQNPVSYSQVLTTDRLGNHSCEASCPINGINCTFVAMRIIVLEEETSKDSTKTLLIATLIPTVTILLVIVGLCVGLLFYRIRKDRPRSTNEAHEPEENAVLCSGDKSNIQTRTMDKEIATTTSQKMEEITTQSSLEMGRAISGIAALEDMIYVVSVRSSEVEMFDITTYKLKDRVKVEKMENPWDLTSCRLNKWLYVMDLRPLFTPMCVLRVDSNGKMLDEWSTGHEYGNLSVTGDGNVIVTFCEKRELVIYSPGGKEINFVFLSDDLVHPSHALKMSIDQFLICHGINKDNIHGVSILNLNGKIIKKSMESMSAPSYLAVDDNGLIFVADQGNRRVCVMNPDLELIAEVALKQDRLPGSQRICLYVKAEKLLVVDNALESRRRNEKLSIVTYNVVKINDPVLKYCCRLELVKR